MNFTSVFLAKAETPLPCAAYTSIRSAARQAMSSGRALPRRGGTTTIFFPLFKPRRIKHRKQHQEQLCYLLTATIPSFFTWRKRKEQHQIGSNAEHRLQTNKQPNRLRFRSPASLLGKGFLNTYFHTF